MMCCERKEDLVHEEDVFEIVYDTFSIEKVHCGCEEVPIDGPGVRQIPRLRWYLSNGNNFFEGDHLNSGNDHEDVDVSGKHGCEEASNHSKGPYRSGNEGCLFLLIF